MDINSLRAAARAYAGDGVTVIPLDDKKVPALFAWKDIQTTPLTVEEMEALFSGRTIRLHLEREVSRKDGSGAFTARGIGHNPKREMKGLAIVCGTANGNLEVIDVDCKYDLTGELWPEFRDLMKEHLKDVFDSLVVAETVNKGYHVYFRCEAVEGNAPLSARPSTPEELEKDPDREERVLIETRGLGGYIAAEPTPGYRFISGSFATVPEITPQQREVIFGIARSFNQVEKEVLQRPSPKREREREPGRSGLLSWEDYNSRDDFLDLLQGEGWTITGRSGGRIQLRRPGATSDNSSGNFQESSRRLHIHTTNAAIPPGNYSPTAVYAQVRCGGTTKEDFQRAATELYEQGYGDRKSYRDRTGEPEETMRESRSAGPVSVETDGIRVDVETRSGETVPLAGDEPITLAGVKALSPVKVRLYHESSVDLRRVIKTVQLLDRIPSCSVFVASVLSLSEADEAPQHSFRAGFEHIYDAVINIYADIADEQGGYLTAEQEDALVNDLLDASARLRKKTDSDRFINLLRNDGQLQEMGITPETLEKVSEQNRANTQASFRAETLQRIVSKSDELRIKGSVGEAVRTLEEGLRDLKREEGSSLLPDPCEWSSLRQELEVMNTGLSTGYPSLDAFVSFVPGAITLVAGRPSHGKTTLLLNFLLNLAADAEREGSSLYFFNYEEPRRNIAVKLLSILHGQELPAYWGTGKKGNYAQLKRYFSRSGDRDPATARTDGEIEEAIREAEQRLARLIDSRTIVLVDRPYSVESLERVITYQAREEKIRAVFVDYVQRIPTETKTQDKRTEVGHVSDVLLRTAVATDIPLIVGAQLNRGAAKDNYLSLEHLKEAGDLEEDSNTVLGVFDPHRAATDATEREAVSMRPTVDLKVTSLKNREGEVNRSTELTKNKRTWKVTDTEPPLDGHKPVRDLRNF